MRIKKIRRGNAGGYEWQRDGDVVDVDNPQIAADLIKMAGFELLDPLPEREWVPGAVAQKEPVVRTHVPIRKEKVGAAAHYNWAQDGAVVLVEMPTALELLRQPGFSEAEEAEVGIRDVEATAQDALVDPAKVVVGSVSPSFRDPRLPPRGERIVPKSQRVKTN